MIAEVFLDLIGLELSEILRSSSAIHDREGNWSSSAFADVGNHGAPNRKSVRHRVNFSARGSVTLLGGKHLEAMNVGPWISLPLIQMALLV